MKVYLQPDTNSRGIMRVANALLWYLPHQVQVVSDPSEADLTILHINGRNEGFRAKIDALRAAHREYAMIQYVLKSTKKPSVIDWMDLWADARCVWSYYDLQQIMKDEIGAKLTMNFYYAPLGVDGEVFKEQKVRREFICAVHSQSYLTESAREIIKAAERIGRKVFYLGNNIKRPNVLNAYDISDFQLANMYSRSQYVSGLRRIEGFEQPVIEGLLCGARPIVFDRPEMRQWFGDLAVFIPELPRDETIDYLEGVFRSPGNNVTEAEKVLALNRFNWSIIISEFWNKVL